MRDDDDAARRPLGEPSEAKYYGPFGEPPPVPGPGPEAVAAYSLPDRTAPTPVSAWPPPASTSARLPRTGSHATAGGNRRRGPRAGAVIGVAALTALLIGGGAGYGGAVLAGRTAEPVAAPGPTATAAAPEPSTAPSGTGEPEPAPGGGFDPVAVAAKALPGTVTVQVGRSTGSGFLIDDQGRIVTNNHVISGAAAGATIRISFADGRRQTATLVGRSPSYDLAVLKVKPAGYLRPLVIGDSDALRIGEPVLALGAPLGLSDSVTQGIISAVDRPVVVQSDGNADAPFAFIDGVQTDAAINPGSSGGPLVDAQARVVGVNSAILTRGNSAQGGNVGVGFAIPINQAKTIVDLLIADGKASYPVIGANLREVSGGLELTQVDDDGPASKAGLRTGDRVTKIDDRRVDRTEEMIVEIRTRRPGEKVILEYERGNARARATVTLGGREG